MLSLSRDHVHVAEVDHVLYTVPDMKKDRVLIKLIELENPTTAIIFCNTKSEVNYVSLILQKFGYDADALSSELRQKERDKVLRRVRAGTLRLLVATDVAARGIDVREISHVFQYEVPEDPEVYVHRAGRTGRAGAGGTAITLAYRLEKIRVSQIRDLYSIEFEEREPPSEEDLENVVAQRLIARLETRLRGCSKLERERMERFVPMAKELGESNGGAALVAMLLDDSYHESLKAPLVSEDAPAEETVEAEEAKESRKSKEKSKHPKRRRSRRG
jgi:ATP-dependent RNA helicase DeaD